jgi:hypothetical protein
MAKSKQKTTETGKSVSAFVKAIPDRQRQGDCLGIIKIMEQASGEEAKMWGPAIIGFGTYHYKYESGHEGDAPLVGFSPRKNEFALYLANFEGREEMLKKLGKHKSAKACVYIKGLADVDEGVLKKMITATVKYYKAKYK